MNRKFAIFNFSTVIFLILIITIPLFEAAKRNIFDFADDKFTAMDVKSRAMGELASECLVSEDKPIVVSGSVKYQLIRYLHGLTKMSITLVVGLKLPVEENYAAALESREKYCGQHYYRFMRKLVGFLVSPFSIVDLKHELDILKNSRWWNAAGYFIFTDSDYSKSESCSNAYDFLSLAWRYELLSSVYLCKELDGNLSIYSYNPYGNSAPQSWIKSREIKGPQGHPWNLFKWQNHEGRNFDCDKIFFDKTKSLNGYPMLTNGVNVPPYLMFNENETGVEKYKGQDVWIMKDVWEFLEASIIDVPLSTDKKSVIGWVDENGTVHGNLIDISTGKIEIGINSMIRQPLWKVTALYPHSASLVCFLTKDRGTIPWLLGLGLFADGWTIICTDLLFFSAVMIFGYFDKHRYLRAFLNTLRIYFSTSFLRPPRSNNLRLILLAVFIFPLVSYSTFQGSIVSLIRNPQHYANIDDIRDLVVQGFKLESSEAWRRFIPNDIADEIFVPIKGLNSCLKKVRMNEKVACASLCLTLYASAAKDKNLHVSLDHSTQWQHQFIAKPDWPLLDRFNVVLRRIVEAGLIHFYETKGWYEEISSSANYLENDSSDTAIHISLREFKYIFKGLGIGWIFGIIVFICELLIFRLKNLKRFKIRIVRV